MAKLLTEHIITPHCPLCQKPCPIYQFVWDGEGNFWAISYHCETLVWQCYPIEKIIADVMATQNGKPAEEEPKKGMDNGYI